MKTFIKREFIVKASINAAFAHLADAEKWPSWAKHIRQVEMKPTGSVTAESEGILHLSNGIKTHFRMTKFEPPHAWEWVGKFLGLTIIYDHQFTVISSQQTQISFIVSAEGFGLSTIGRIFAAVYNANLDRAIPNLIAEFEDS